MRRATVPAALLIANLFAAKTRPAAVFRAE
jgi:hypothetical protein